MKKLEDKINEATLVRYFTHIGFKPHEISRENLEKIIQAHLGKFVYNNIELYRTGGLPLGKRYIPSLEINNLASEMLKQNSGYCFQHLELVYAVLEASGYTLERHLAKVILQPYLKLNPAEHTKVKTHEFLVVTLENKRYILDVGMCNTSLRSLLELKPGEQTIGADQYMICQQDDIWMLCTKAPGKEDWFCIYHFLNNPMSHEDIVKAHRDMIQSTEDIPIMHKILIGKTTAHKRKDLTWWMNGSGFFRSVKENGDTKTTTFKTFEETANFASMKFGISLD